MSENLSTMRQSTSRAWDVLSSRKFEIYAYVVILVIAFATRLPGLGDRVVSHDESLHTQFSYQLYDGSGYSHTPLMHGPTLFHVTALSYWLFGASDMSARLPVAVLGSLLVLAPLLFRSWIGRGGALAASVFLLISPFFSYYSRYIRHEIYVISAALLLLWGIWSYLSTRSDRSSWAVAAGLGLMFATMETSYLYTAMFGGFIVIRLLVKAIAGVGFKELLVGGRKGIVVILVFVAVLGFARSRFSTLRELQVVESAAETSEDAFSADPDEPELGTDGLMVAGESRALRSYRWVQVIALAGVSLGLFMTARSLREKLREYPEFDIVILLTTLVLPTVSAFVIRLAGFNPRESSNVSCAAPAGDSSNGIMESIRRLFDSECIGSYLGSNDTRIMAFVVVILLVSAAVGLWWDKKRWVVAAGIFHVVFLLFFTTMLTNPTGWTSGMVNSLSYWLDQQVVRRGSQPDFYYLLIVPLYEYAIMILSLAAALFWSGKSPFGRLVRRIGLTVAVVAIGWRVAEWVYLGYIAQPGVFELSTTSKIAVQSVLATGSALYWVLRGRIPFLDQVREDGGFFASAEKAGLVSFLAFLISWLIASWLFFSWAGEKMPWLTTHFVVPMALLSGWLVGRFFDRPYIDLVARSAAAKHAFVTVLVVVSAGALVFPILSGSLRIGALATSSLVSTNRYLGLLAVMIAALLFWMRTRRGVDPIVGKRSAVLFTIIGLALLTARTSYFANYVNDDYVTEFNVYAHGAPATKSVVLERLETISMRLHGDKSVKVAYDNDSSWPFTWYLRDYPNREYFGDSPSRSITDAEVVIVGSNSWSKVDPLLEGQYVESTHTFLWWPMEQYRKLTANSILGDPKVERGQRRGLFNPDVRASITEIFLHRDYEKYQGVYGGNLSISEWPLRHDLKLYIRNDVVVNLAELGIGGDSVELPEVPYSEKELIMEPVQVIGLDAVAAGSALLNPRNVVVGNDGTVYVADTGNHRIAVFAPDGTYQSSFGSFGSEPGQLNEPWAVAVFGEFLVVADTWNHRLQLFSMGGEFVRVIGGSGSPSGDDGAYGLFFGPRDVVVIPSGLAVSDTGNHRIQLFDESGSFEQSSGSSGFAPGQYSEPVGMAVLPGGGVVVADTWNSRIQVLNSNLEPVRQFRVEGWLGTSISNKPYLAVGNGGEIFVTDPEAYRVLIFDQLGSYLGRFGYFSAGTDGFGLPTGLATDSEGFLYVADAANNRILKFDVEAALSVGAE